MLVTSPAPPAPVVVTVKAGLPLNARYPSAAMEAVMPKGCRVLFSWLITWVPVKPLAVPVTLAVTT